MRKLKQRKSTEANLIHRLVETGFDNCSCAIVSLGGKIMLTCACDDLKKLPVAEEPTGTKKRKKVTLPSDAYQ